MEHPERPPCWPEGQPCPNHCAGRQYRRIVWNETTLYGAWSGWRLIGARLVSPSGEWISAPLLDRMLWREAQLYRDLRRLKGGSSGRR